MIKVELRRPIEGAIEYEAVAWLSVGDDGTYRVTDPEELFPLALHVLVPGGGHLHTVDFEDDPETWARNLGSVLRTGYLVPVTVHDSRRRRRGPTEAP